MSAPDAETYLRCRLEDALIAGSGSGREGLANRVRAALAVGVITDDAAEELLADAERAFAIRDEDEFGAYPEDEHPAPPRVVTCPTVIEQDWGTLVISHVAFGEHETTLGVSGVLHAARSRNRHRHRDRWAEIDIDDATGTTHHAHFSGGSSGNSFDGEYSVHPRLDPASTSITVAGRRIDLVDPPTPPVVRIDELHDLSALDRARRHLELALGGNQWRNSDDAQDARETFTDLGLDIPEDADASTAKPARAPGQRGRRSQGAGRYLGIGVTTPQVDGLVITLAALTDAGRLSISGTARGRINVEQHWPPPVLVSAVDDLGTHYVCHHDSGGGGSDGFQSTGRLVPALDPHATRLTIILDTLCHRALVDVPLDWQEPR